ncbi:autotransporter outer membrane beta-barrel domain-containing protein [Alphaproteobacteria bacterium]|nr:autotransporter outer membrane beta-barrel domain-containing protein [Alphaproteobacteria bacterium]
MNFLRKITMFVVISLSLIALNYKAHATNTTSSGDYGLSCTNSMYGGLGNVTDGQANGYLNNGDLSYGIYTGEDCAYSGAGRTNSSVIVGGEIARAAANAIIGAVNGRLSAALANNNTAAHMSYSSNGNGIGMAANHLVGGLSMWTNFSSSNFENDQTFTNVQLDSNQFDGDASSMSFGIDKRFGNLLVGGIFTNFDSDIDTKVNSGTITTEGETFGLYVGMNSSAVNFSAGAGTGEYEVTTTRKDLGSLLTINGNDITADVKYWHVNLSSNISRGKLSFSPRVGYRSFDLDMPAFTDVVPNDTNTFLLATRTNAVAESKVTDNESVAAQTYSSDMTEAGISIALSTNGKLTPYIDVAYVHEDTTSAAYETEDANDSGNDLGASAPDGYITYGGGVMLNMSGKVSGYINVSETTNRTDFSETSISGTLKLKF